MYLYKQWQTFKYFSFCVIENNVTKRLMNNVNNNITWGSKRQTTDRLSVEIGISTLYVQHSFHNELVPREIASVLS